MKKALIIIGSLAAVGGITYGIIHHMKSIPKIDVEQVDWLHKTVTLNMSAGKGMKGGTFHFGENGKASGQGGYSFNNSSEGDMMFFEIVKDGKVVAKKTFDFKNTIIK
jgi:hypothetical protein